MSPRRRSDPALVEQVHRALRCANQALSACLRVALLREGLPFSRFAILRLLVVRGPATSKALADALRVTTANMPGLIDRLEADGLVRRRRSRKDRRAILIGATPRGRRTFVRLKDIAVEELVRAFEGWTEAELRELLEFLNRFAGKERARDLTQLQGVRTSRFGRGG
jgi:DNA-binding MarR family transcriptional regulator